MEGNVVTPESTQICPLLEEDILSSKSVHHRHSGKGHPEQKDATHATKKREIHAAVHRQRWGGDSGRAQGMEVGLRRRKSRKE